MTDPPGAYHPPVRDLPSVVALDAMGVLYRDGDVVTGLLVPYLRGKGCRRSPEVIRGCYHECTRGEIGTAELWAKLGVAEVASDHEYCRAHRLTPGVVPMLTALAGAGVTIACLSNDAAEWSLILRHRFDLGRYVTRWYVSAEIGARKPDPRAYAALLDGLAVDPSEVVFVDDRGPNLVGARAAGMPTVLFGSEDTDRHPVPDGQVRVDTMAELTAELLHPPRRGM